MFYPIHLRRFVCPLTRLLSLLACTVAMVGQAQTTGGVFGPVVKEGHRFAQYRLASDPDSGQLAQRFHYQQSVNIDLMWRIVLQARETSQRTTDTDFIQGELFWQLSEDQTPWHYGLRFDLRVRDGDRANLLGINFSNELKLAPKLSARAVVLSAIEWGEQARDGVFIGTRGRLNYQWHPQLALGIEVFNSYGSSEALPSFEQQRHQLGPYALLRFARHWQLSASILSGVTEATADTNMRLFIGRTL